jgi:transcriptional regulator with XRE-family HTH domain
MMEPPIPTPNERLQAVRKQYNWTIGQASERVGVDIRTYRRWERGNHTPHLRALRKLCEAFSMSVEELGFDIE